MWVKAVVRLVNLIVVLVLHLGFCSMVGMVVVVVLVGLWLWWWCWLLCIGSNGGIVVLVLMTAAIRVAV